MERLLNYFKPENYNIELNIDKHKGTARGRTVITGSPTAEGEKQGIKLHAVGLTIDRIRVNDKITKFTHEDTVLTVPVQDSAPSVLEIDYHFTLNTNMQGAYLSNYRANNKDCLMVSTQFESHYARECFPCIDEPAAKATFDLSITIPKEDENDIVLSNMDVREVKSIALSDDATGSRHGKMFTFETTPKMSTYLLAFCIGEFRKKSKTSLHGVKVTTYATPAHSESALNYANDIAVKSLDYYDRHFGVRYPLKKLDQVAIPDFEAGAMENWGLVTYRESCLLADKTTSKTQKEYIATVIAHELSHQWFGDLVTMEWWNNLWLNESFATLMEYLCVDAIHPEYHIFEDFFTGECAAALNRDSLPGVQAVQQDVDDPAEIATLFDSAIVYAKGARLMFMLYRLMGERAFFAGLKAYFKKHKYSNTTGDDLWEALQPHAKFDVKEFMDAWILQPGLPVVTDGEQQRFLLNGAADDTKWPLPKIADDMSGHYLINLSSDEFATALKNFSKLDLEQKIRLLLDRGLLAKTSLVSSATILELLPHFRNETAYPIWSPIVGLINNLKIFFPASDPDFPKFKQYIYTVISPQLLRLGAVPKSENSTDEDLKLRHIILGLALFVEDMPTLKTLAALYDRDYSKINPEIRYFVLAAKMKLSEPEVFDEMLEVYRTTVDPEINGDLLFVLASAEKHEKRLLELLKQPKIVRPQDHLYLYIRLARNPKMHKLAVKWLYDNWDYVVRLSGEKSVEDYPRLLASTIRTREEADEFEQFFAEKSSDPVLKRAVAVANSEINSRLRLIELDNALVHKKLEIF